MKPALQLLLLAAGAIALAAIGILFKTTACEGAVRWWLCVMTR
jgi:hypothetical protein